MVILGQPFSGKTTALRTMMLSIAANYSPDEVMMVLIDFSRKLWKASQTSLANIPHVVQTIDDIEQLDDFLENMKIECAEFDTKPKRRKIMIFIDNYDAFTEEASRKKMSFFESLSMLIRKYQTAGVFLIVSGSLAIMSSSDDLRKVYVAPNFGIGLKSADAVDRLNGKFPRSLADAELPMGRAFTVRSGITNMLQIATPYANDEDIEGSLDLWVNRIKERYPQKNVTWLSGGKVKKAAEQSGPTGVPAAPAAPDLSKYNIPDIKKLLIASGLPDSVISLFSDSDLVENARAMGLLDAKPETPSEDKAGEKPEAKSDEKGKKKKAG
jgi:DNA segregation ATPase FtsK/SpoIIIE, S-DNA-T family